MNKLQKVVYTAHATSTGGRDGRTVSSDKAIDLKLAVPKEMGGVGGEGTNPEQLFAAGYSACFIGAIKAMAAKDKIQVPNDISIQSSVSFGPIEVGYGIAVDMKITIPGMDKPQAQALVEKAHQICPYSNATRGNIEVALSVV